MYPWYIGQALRLKSVGDTISKNPLLQQVSEYPSYWNNLLISRSNVIVRIITTVVLFFLVLM